MVTQDWSQRDSRMKKCEKRAEVNVMWEEMNADRRRDRRNAEKTMHA